MKRQAIVAQELSKVGAEDQGITVFRGVPFAQLPSAVCAGVRRSRPCHGWCAASLRFRAYRDAADAGCLR